MTAHADHDVTTSFAGNTAAPNPVAAVRPQRLVLAGAATGAAIELAVAIIYQLIRIGFHLATDLTANTTGQLPAPESADRIFGVVILGGLLSLPPSAAAGALTGGLIAAVLKRTWLAQGPIRAWLTGSVVAYVVAFAGNAFVLVRQRKIPMAHHTWLHYLGYPSLIFVIVFGLVGLWLYLSRTWTIKP